MGKVEKFHQLRSEKVMTSFHIREIRQCGYLDALLRADVEPLTITEQAIIDLALARYHRLGRGWNEEELKMHFISPILGVADPNIESICKTFFERSLTGVINEYELVVIAEGPNLVIHQPDALLEQMDEWNKTHHGGSGLIEAVKKSTITMEIAESQTITFLKQYLKLLSTFSFRGSFYIHHLPLQSKWGFFL